MCKAEKWKTIPNIILNGIVRCYMSVNGALVGGFILAVYTVA